MSSYSRVHHQIWGDEKFLRLSDPQPNGKSLWLYIVTGPHNLGVPGLFAVSRGDLMDRLGDWDRAGFDDAWAELEREGLAEADWDARFVFVPGVLHRDPPANPNIVKSWWRMLGLFPECALAFRAITELVAWCDEKGTEWGAAIRQACIQGLSRRSLSALGLEPSVREEAPETKIAAEPFPANPGNSGIRSPVFRSPQSPPPAGGPSPSAWPEARAALTALRLSPTDPSAEGLVAGCLEALGWQIRRDVQVADGGRGRPSRLAMQAERDGARVAIEFAGSRASPRPRARLQTANAEVRVLFLKAGKSSRPEPVPGLDLVVNLARVADPVPVRGSQDYVDRSVVPDSDRVSPDRMASTLAALKAKRFETTPLPKSAGAIAERVLGSCPRASPDERAAS